ncbi:unnamed protein product [Cochlearia groenlandica]
MVELQDQEMGEGVHCIKHPYTKNNGGICALCLQDKLGKLVTSSFTSSSSTTSLSLSETNTRRDSTINNNNNNNQPFLLASSSSSANIIYKRSKSTASAYGESLNQRKRSGFWSFLHLYSSKHQISSTTKKVDTFSHLSSSQRTEIPKRVDVIVEEEEEEEERSNKIVAETTTTTTNSVIGSSFGRKVMRSRSVGCGSRSFSSDCALKRIESQREHTKAISNSDDMVKCGGIFGGFMIMTSSSSSTTSSSVDYHHSHHKMGSKNRGWGFTSPMRGKTHRTITESTINNNTSSNLDSTPSLLALSS